MDSGHRPSLSVVEQDLSANRESMVMPAIEPLLYATISDDHSAVSVSIDLRCLRRTEMPSLHVNRQHLLRLM